MIWISSVLVIITLLLFWKYEEKRYRKLQSNKKSGEVILGQISETLAPVLKDFPIEGDPKDITFLGQPIDYIHFSNKKITFIEIKSGKSRLSTKQRKIKKMIEEGNVEFKTYRIPSEK